MAPSPIDVTTFPNKKVAVTQGIDTHAALLAGALNTVNQNDTAGGTIGAFGTGGVASDFVNITFNSTNILGFIKNFTISNPVTRTYYQLVITAPGTVTGTTDIYEGVSLVLDGNTISPVIPESDSWIASRNRSDTGSEVISFSPLGFSENLSESVHTLEIPYDFTTHGSLPFFLIAVIVNTVILDDTHAASLTGLPGISTAKNKNIISG